MVSIDIFAGSGKNQFLRTLIAIVILVLSDSIYYSLTSGMYGGTRFKNGFPLMPYITLWITVGSVFGACEIQNSSEQIVKDESITMAADSAQFGVLIALLIYGPVYAFVYHPNGSPIIALLNFAFSLIICAITGLLVNVISQEHSLYGD